jgi:integrase
MLTGCRPEEAFALTWDDIRKHKNRKAFISFTKAYTYGELRNQTKTGVDRLFPCNPQMIEFLSSIPRLHKRLIFPAVEGGYLIENNINKRQWTSVTNGLMDKGFLDIHYPFYNIFKDPKWVL